MLSFALGDEGRTVKISCDEEGMAKLIKALERLRVDAIEGCRAYEGSLSVAA
jgi:hypothetical protein